MQTVPRCRCSVARERGQRVQQDAARCKDSKRLPPISPQACVRASRTPTAARVRRDKDTPRAEAAQIRAKSCAAHARQPASAIIDYERR